MEARVSTFKRGHGPEELFSDSLEKYWHTDGNLPHHIEIEFPEIRHLAEIKLTLGHLQDKSYTPKEIDIRCGKTRSTIASVRKLSISDKSTVITIPIDRECTLLQLVILSNHQEGRDSRVRGLALVFND